MARRRSLTLPRPPADPGGWRTELAGTELELPPGTITAVVTAPGDDPVALARSLRERCGAGGRRPRVWSDEDVELVSCGPVFGNVMAPLRALGADLGWCRRTALHLLDIVGLAGRAEEFPSRLSAGERRRAVLAVALAHGPDVVVLADPAGGLDERGAGGVLAALDRVRAELGATVVFVTGDARQAGRVADRVALCGADPVCEPVFAALADPGSAVGLAVLPPLGATLPAAASHPVLVDVVVIGHAALGFLASADVVVVAEARSKVGETPVARCRVGVREAAVLVELERVAASVSVVEVEVAEVLAA